MPDVFVDPLTLEATLPFMAFAVGLLLSTATLSGCALLAQPGAAGQRRALVALLGLVEHNDVGEM